MSAKVEESVVPPLLALMRLLYQQWRSPALSVVTQLGIADVLGDGSRTVAELAEATGTHGPSLYRLLRALARIGVFVECGGACFANSEMSQLLRTDVPGSISAMAAMTSGLMGGAFGGLLHSVRTGEPGFDQAYGMPMWREGHALASIDEYHLSAIARIFANNIELAIDFAPSVFQGDLLVFASTINRPERMPSPDAWIPYIEGIIETYHISSKHGRMTQPVPLAEIGSILAVKLQEITGSK